MFGEYKNIHFVGIGGIGMSGIAELLHTMKFKITGSDIYRSEITERLEKLGINVIYEHKAENVKNADVVVYSSAIKKDNPEIVEAKKLSIPIIQRAEMLAELMRMKFSIAIAGTHGKTTTTSMIGHILTYSDLDPTIIVGGRIRGPEINARMGMSEYLVCEADESDKSFLKLFPTISVITNIDEEHLDKYLDKNDIIETFIEFANRIPFYGNIYLNYEDKNCRDIREKINKNVTFYGFSKEAKVRATSLKRESFYYSFTCEIENKKFGEIKLSIPGIHNVLNSLAAIGVATDIGISFEKIKESIKNFKGVIRRFEIKCVRNDIMIVDDYAHHPREIISTLRTAREGWDGRIVAIFQPHLYSRTILLKDEFGKSFYDADVVIITDIYPSREEKIPRITGELIAKTLIDYGHKEVHYIESLKEIPNFVRKIIKKKDLIITIGAGNINRVAEEICVSI